MPEVVGLLHVVRGGVLFRNCTTDPLSTVQGLKKRLVHERTPPEKGILSRLAAYVQVWLRKFLRPLRADEIKTFAVWLEGVNQPETVKDEYRKAFEAWNQGEVPGHKLNTKKCFVKNEFYDEAKYPRLIHSPTNYEKVLHGPLSNAIEAALFALPFFIKKVPRREWPSYIARMCAGDGLNSYASDYSTFEASFVPEIQQACELALVRYMLQDFLHEEGAADMAHGDKRNELISRQFLAWILGRRKSGQMTTSLFNGFTNFVVHSFVAEEENHCKYFSGVVEGDDGLFVFDGPQPTVEQFAALGFTIKLEPVQRFFEASFCGVVFHPDVGVTLGNPLRVLFSCSWAGKNYLRAGDKTLRNLGVVKGLSYLAQYPGCPVIHNIACWLLRVNGFEREKLDYYLSWYAQQRGVSWWDREISAEIAGFDIEEAIRHPIEMGSRLVIEKVHRLPIAMQVIIESRLDAASGDVELEDLNLDPRYLLQWDRYVRVRDKFDLELRVPYHLPPLHPIQGMDRMDYYSPDLTFRTMVPHRPIGAE
jgi:hypothetical protein